MCRTYRAAFAQGTILNHQRQAKAYLQFMLKSKSNYLDPSLHLVLMFAQSLANSHKNTRYVKNYLSGVKLFVRNIGGNVTNFDSLILANLIKGIARMSNHIPSSAPALSASCVCRCADDLYHQGPVGVVARGALLFVVATFLRQSNLVMAGPTTNGHLRRQRDVKFTDSGLHVNVNSTKTILDPRDAVVIPVAAAPGSRYCPVAALLCVTL